MGGGDGRATGVKDRVGIVSNGAGLSGLGIFLIMGEDGGEEMGVGFFNGVLMGGLKISLGLEGWITGDFTTSSLDILMPFIIIGVVSRGEGG